MQQFFFYIIYLFCYFLLFVFQTFRQEIVFPKSLKSHFLINEFISFLQSSLHFFLFLFLLFWPTGPLQRTLHSLDINHHLFVFHPRTN